jgi:transglutaminase-like putative cysteine protease
MANAEALKKRKSNLPPPPVAEVSENIHPRQPVDSATSYERADARSFRRTGRTIQFNIRVTEDFDRRVREIAQRERRTLAEVLERAMALYDQDASE